MGLVQSKQATKCYDRVVATQANCHFDDLEALLVAIGFRRRSPRSGGSHYTYTRGTLRITIPKARPVKRHYVREVLKLLDD